MDRRSFLKSGLAASALLSAGPAAGQYELLARGEFANLPGLVAVAGDLIPPGRALRSNRDPVPAERVGRALERCMTALLGSEPWARLFAPHEIVAIKVNGLASGHLSPRPELVWAVVAGLRAAGVRDSNIVIWERTTRELERSGFAPQTGEHEVRVYGTDALKGSGYAQQIESFGQVGSLVSRVLTEYADALINVGVLKDHDLAGVSAGMKNLYGAIHNPNRYHDNACDPYVAHVTALPSIRSKLRLTVIDAILGQAHAGPAYNAEWIWPCGRLLVAADPVACDRVAADLIAAARAARGLPSLEEAGREPVWIATAARLGLGHDSDLEICEV